MTVHLVKMCVGIESVEHLAQVQVDRLRRAGETESEPALCHITRHTPKRAAELCEDGSLYWAVRGFIAVRQRVLACERRVNREGRPSCALVLAPELVRTELRAARPFQGWRYLAPEKAPRDLSASDGDSAELPPEIAEELRSIAEAVSCPVVLYTNPNFQRSDLSLPVLERLAKIPNIGYLKDASTNTGRLLTIMNRVGDDLKIFSASAHIPACVMMIGGVGWMAGPACLIPALSVKLYDLTQAGAWAEAMELQRRLWAVNQVFARYSLAACIKGGLEMMGFDVGAPFAPQPALSSLGQTDVRRVLEELGVLA